MECQRPPVLVRNSLSLSTDFRRCNPYFHEVLGASRVQYLSHAGACMVGRSSFSSATSVLSSSVPFPSHPRTKFNGRPSQEEKRAQRRHRRILARIVVDQWKYVARTRLLAVRLQKINQINLLRHCLKSWKEYVSNKSRKMEKVKVAIETHHFILMRKGFCAWLSYLCHKQVLDLAFNSLCKIATSWVYDKAFSAWKTYVQLHQMQRNHLLTADHFWKLSLSLKYMRCWQLGMQNRHERKYLKKTASAMWVKNRLRSAWNGWREFLENRYSSNHLQSLAAAMHRRKIAKCFEHWHRWAVGYGNIFVFRSHSGNYTVNSS